MPEIAIVIPAYNAAGFLADRIRWLSDELQARGIAARIVLVNDGSSDTTAAVIDALCVQHSHVVAVQLAQNVGKFGAIAAGMKASEGISCRIFTDADVPYGADVIPKMVSLVNVRGYHMVVGDRTLPGSVYSERLPWLRRSASKAFTTFIRLAVTGGLHDTQCGIKAYRGDVADALFPLLQEPGFAGDVEALYIALKHNLSIRRVPVQLRFSGSSSVRVLEHSARMFAAALRLRARYQRGEYASPALEAISDAS